VILLVGLGNFENKYLKNRHNVGFHFLDYLIQKYDFTQDVKIEKKIDALIDSKIASQ
jgi:peptidyl-tRNA hydrolase